ncbi:MAG: DNA internalization-related competence protein ComEC/Rec2 [Planctomycetota bacterium]
MTLVLPTSTPGVRPLVLPAVAFALGVFTADAAPSPVLLPAAAGGALALAVLTVLAHRWGRPRTAVAALVCVAFAAGAGRLGAERRPDPLDISKFAGEGAVVAVEGVVTRAPESFGTSGESDGASPGSWLVLGAESLHAGSFRTRVRGKLRVVVGQGTPSLREGDRVRVSGWLSPPRGARNPGEFDFATHLVRNGIGAMLRVPKADAFEREGKGPWWLSLRGAARARISAGLSAIGPEGGLYRALVLGDRSALDTRLEQAFVTSGTAHVLAVSGLNLVLVIAMAAGLARLCGVSARGAGLAALTVALSYAALVGWSPPVTRAAAMAASVLGARLLWRKGDLVNALAAAAILVLAVNPEDLFGAGFQLSFAAVLALVVASQPIARLLRAGPGAPRAWRATGGLVAASLAAGLATAPLTLYHFNIACPVSLAANLAIVPLASLLLGFGAVAGIAGCISPGAVAAVAPAFAWPAAAGRWIVLKLGEAPYGHFWLPEPPALWTAALLVALLLLVKRPRIASAALLVLAGWAGVFFGSAAPDEMRATFLDVGQGACCVLEFPDGDAWVVDCGASARSDPGERVASPYLWTRRRRTIDTLLLTHADADHISGAVSLMERFSVRRLIVTRPFRADPRAASVLRAAAENVVPVQVVQRGDLLRTRSGLEVPVLGPPADTPGWSANDTSILLRVESRGLSLLLIGDAERRAVKAFLQSPVRADVLQVPHHGGSSSRSLELPTAVRPLYAVISARDWFPSPDVEADYRALGIPVERTYRGGAVIFVGTGVRWRVERFVQDPIK